MKRVVTALLFLTTVAVPTETLAGGSDALAVVVSFVNDGGTDYTLVVEPTSAASAEPFPDPYMGHCRRFTVRGTYSRLAGLPFGRPPMVTRRAHLDAIEYLRKASTSRATVRLGWMGTGFYAPNAADPCVVESRALVLFTDEHGTAVVSFYHAI